MKKSAMILFCLLICWMSASCVLAKGYNKHTHQAQKQLSALGYAPGPADGMMGDRTRKAVRKFQKDRGLKPTGTLDSNTMDLLLNGSAVKSTAPVKNKPNKSKPVKNKPKKQDSKHTNSKKPNQGHQKAPADQKHKKNQNPANQRNDDANFKKQVPVEVKP